MSFHLFLLWFFNSQKLTDVRDEDIPDINNPKTITAVLEGDKLMKEVLNGGYNVQTHLALGHSS